MSIDRPLEELKRIRAACVTRLITGLGKDRAAEAAFKTTIATIDNIGRMPPALAGDMANALFDAWPDELL